MEVDINQKGSKRSWTLRDEDSDLEDRQEPGKKLKNLSDTLDDNISEVVVASRQWPQIDQ